MSANKKPLTRDQVDRILLTLNCAYGRADLRCDGYLVQLRMLLNQQTMHFAVWVFIDGKLAPLNCDAPEIKFCNKVTRHVYKRVVRERWAKEAKRLPKGESFGFDYNATTTAYFPWFTSARSALAHMMRVSETIEMVWPEDVAP